MNMLDAIAPRSDQMNAEDLLSGERTFTITDVKVFDAPEQPVHIWFAEFPKERPFKPSKTVSRILVAAWGKDEAVYIGRRLTLYRDPEVTFGKDRVGGIRVKAMSHIPKRFSVMLASTRGKRAPWVVEPLPDDAPTSPPVDNDTVARVAELRAEWKTADDDRKAEIESEVKALTGGSDADA